jgi:putative ABC transport system substrate-binding protein
MKRRDLLYALGSAALGWPLAARAQQPDKVRLIGALMNSAEGDPESQARLAAFADGLEQLGWTNGRNLRIETRWAVDASRNRQAEELIAQAPDVVLASSSANVAALQRITHNVPIVFANVIDPVGAGFVASVARPGGNTTGFSAFEYSLSGKWLELIKELAPNVKRAAILRDPALAAGIGQFAAIQALASPSLGVELTPIDVREPAELKRAIPAFAREQNGSLIITASQSGYSSQPDHIASVAVSPAQRLRVSILPGEWGPRLLRA